MSEPKWTATDMNRALAELVQRRVERGEWKIIALTHGQAIDPPIAKWLKEEFGDVAGRLIVIVAEQKPTAA